MAEREPMRLPGPSTRNPERLQARDYDSDWAVMPAGETDGRTDPGAGPRGSIGTSGQRLSMWVLFAAFALAFLVFFLPETLALGALLGAGALFVVAIALFATKDRTVGNLRGVGTQKVRTRRRDR